MFRRVAMQSFERPKLFVFVELKCKPRLAAISMRLFLGERMGGTGRDLESAGHKTQAQKHPPLHTQYCSRLSFIDKSLLLENIALSMHRHDIP